MHDWITMKELVFCRKYPLTMPKLRKLLLNRKQNGLNQYIKKLGRCLVIKPEDFEKWLQEKGE